MLKIVILIEGINTVSQGINSSAYTYASIGKHRVTHKRVLFISCSVGCGTIDIKLLVR
jgi:hypothetical protein